MNQENQNRMTASAGKSSFTCKQPSVCKWPINWLEPDVPVYSRCLPSCPAFDGLIDGTGLQQRGCCLPGRKPSLSQPWQFLSPAYLLLFPEKDIPLVNEVKDGPLAMNEVTRTQKPDPPHPNTGTCAGPWCAQGAPTSPTWNKMQDRRAVKLSPNILAINI